MNYVILNAAFVGVLALSGCMDNATMAAGNGVNAGRCTDPVPPRDNFISSVISGAENPSEAINELTSGTVNNGGTTTDDSYLAAVETITANAEGRAPVYGNQAQADYAACARQASS
jgi:hypothetical protein